MIKFSIIKNNSQVVGEITMTEYIEMIKKPSPEVMEYRRIVGPNPTLAEMKKRALTAIATSGIFKKTRANENLIEYSGIICIDVDDVEKQGFDLTVLMEKLSADKYILAAHLSVSGNGLAIFFKVDSEMGLHTEAFNQIADYVEDRYKIRVDRSCKDLARQRYLSHDPEAYYNPQARVVKIVEPKVYVELIQQSKFSGNLKSPEPGSRNAFVFQFACNCAREGISAEVLNEFCNLRFAARDFPEREIKSTVESGYKSVAREEGNIPGKRAESADRVPVEKNEPLTSLTFEDDLFTRLPSFLQGLDSITNTKTQRDILLISNLALLSACFPEVFTIHDGIRMYANLFFLIYAPPASNKGKMNLISKIAALLDKLLSHECAKRKRAYNIACKTCKNDNECLENLDEPKCKGLFLDADSSTIAMIQMLEQGMVSFLIDTEAAVLSQNRRNDWAQLDPILRKAYHFERISVSRKEKTITINDPRISMLISGTVEDAKVFSGSVKGGLASRILPYSFRTPMEWQSQFSESAGIPDFIDGKAKELIAIYEYIKAFPFEFKLTETQQRLHTDTFTAWTDDLENEDVFAFLKRLGVATVRLAMILTALRRVERGDREPVVVCDDDLFEIAISLADTFRQKGMDFYKLLSESQGVRVPKPYQVLHSLPKTFKTNEFVEVAKRVMMINERQAKFHLNKLVEMGKLHNISHGRYQQP